MMTPRTSPQLQLPTRTLSRVDASAHSGVGFVESDTDTAYGAEKVLTSHVVGAVLYKSSTSREAQIQQYVRIHRKETTGANVD